MKKRALLLIATLMLGMTLAMSSTVLAETTDPYDSAISPAGLKSAVKTLFEQEKFAELEDMAKEFRDKKSCFQTGWPKLEAFYSAFTSCNVDSEQAYEKTFQILDRWAKAFPGSITVRVAEGKTWINYAWLARGGGYADTVTKKGWHLFDVRIQKAYEVLSQAPDPKAGDCPQRYASLLRVGMAQSWDRVRYEKLFDEAIAFDNDYYPIYMNKAIYLLPRWSGEEGDWQKFAEDAVKLTPKSEGMSVYTRLAWDIHAYGGGVWKNFQEGGVSWPKMKQGFLDIEKNHPGSDYNLNFFTLFAVLANDKQTARGLFERIGDKPDLMVWKTRAYYDKYRKIANSDEVFHAPSLYDGEKKRLSCLSNAFYFCRAVFCAEPPVGLLAAFYYGWYALFG